MTVMPVFFVRGMSNSTGPGYRVAINTITGDVTALDYVYNNMSNNGASFNYFTD